VQAATLRQSGQRLAVVRLGLLFVQQPHRQEQHGAKDRHVLRCGAAMPTLAPVDVVALVIGLAAGFAHGDVRQWGLEIV
jgi:hypothetical protein